MKEKYYFCFRFDAITLQNNVEDDLAAMTKFQIEIMRSIFTSIQNKNR